MIQNLFGNDDGQVHDPEPTRSAGGLSILDSGPDTNSESGEQNPGQ